MLLEVRVDVPDLSEHEAEQIIATAVYTALDILGIPSDVSATLVEEDDRDLVR